MWRIFVMSQMEPGVCVKVKQHGGIKMEISIPKIRKSVRAHTGSEVSVRALYGEEKVEITRGVIAETYPSIFVVSSEKEESLCKKKAAFSYCDILTKEIELSLCS